MIEVRRELFPTAKETDLRNWLNRGEIRSLIDAAEARQKEFEAAAINDAEKQGDFPNFNVSTTENFREAERIRIFVKVLNEIKDAPEPYYLVRLK